LCEGVKRKTHTFITNFSNIHSSLLFFLFTPCHLWHLQRFSFYLFPSLYLSPLADSVVYLCLYWDDLWASKDTDMCGTICLIFFLGEYSSVWLETYCVLSQIQLRFLRGILTKSYFGRIFQKFCANQGYPLLKFVKFHPTFCNFILGPYCVEKFQKHSHKYFQMFFCTLLRKHVHKKITKKKI